MAAERLSVRQLKEILRQKWVLGSPSGDRRASVASPVAACVLGMRDMRLHELEHRVLSIIDRVLSGDHTEDSLVELKAQWPDDPMRAARRLAGHANAARGAPILWIIGVDEHGCCVSGAARAELANWWARVRSRFDGVWPNVVDLAVPVESASVVALHFETDRAPYVVTNPDGGQITHEVPWRDATGVRSARREDLLRLLVPVLQVPQYEVLSATIMQSNRAAANHTLMIGHVEIDVFITPLVERPLCVPFHRCDLRVRLAGDAWSELAQVLITEAGTRGDAARGGMQWTAHRAQILGPARAVIHGEMSYVDLQRLTSALAQRGHDLEVEATIPIVGADVPLRIAARLPPAEASAPQQLGRWSMQ